MNHDTQGVKPDPAETGELAPDDPHDAAAWDAASKAKDRLAAANTAASKAMWAMWAAKDDLAQAALDEAAT